MDEGQEPIVAWRMRFRDAQADALGTKLQITEVIEELPKNGDRARYIAFPLAVRAGFSWQKWRVAFRRAVEEEQAFGHAFLLAPVSLGLGSLAWFSFAQTPGLLKTALLMCIFGMAAFLSGRVVRLGHAAGGRRNGPQGPSATGYTGNDCRREAGLAHLLAISGLNMVLAAGTFLIARERF